jgi:hypothetical protein
MTSRAHAVIVLGRHRALVRDRSGTLLWLPVRRPSDLAATLHPEIRRMTRVGRSASVLVALAPSLVQVCRVRGLPVTASLHTSYELLASNLSEYFVGAHGANGLMCVERHGDTVWAWAMPSEWCEAVREALASVDARLVPAHVAWAALAPAPDAYAFADDGVRSATDELWPVSSGFARAVGDHTAEATERAYERAADELARVDTDILPLVTPSATARRAARQRGRRRAATTAAVAALLAMLIVPLARLRWELHRAEERHRALERVAARTASDRALIAQLATLEHEHARANFTQPVIIPALAAVSKALQDEARLVSFRMDSTGSMELTLLTPSSADFVRTLRRSPLLADVRTIGELAVAEVPALSVGPRTLDEAAPTALERAVVLAQLRQIRGREFGATMATRRLGGS